MVRRHAFPTTGSVGPLEVSADRDEILVMGTIAGSDLPEDESDGGSERGDRIEDRGVP